MTYITFEVPLWCAILVFIGLGLLFLHLLFGDFIAKIVFKYLEKEDKKNEQRRIDQTNKR